MKAVNKEVKAMKKSLKKFKHGCKVALVVGLYKGYLMAHGMSNNNAQDFIESRF